MRNRNVSKAMGFHMAYVLSRDGIPYRYAKKENGDYVFSVGCSNRRFTEAVEDAECEAQRASTKHHTPVYSLRTLKNPSKKNLLMEMNNIRTYQVLDRDKEAAEQLFIM
ncbi:MAG: hypothetical protein LUE14_04015 [Clostridiales bacterium]|nr:hypothetical protein [Clostridiales bacterium]